MNLYSTEYLKQLDNGGSFLTTKFNDKINTMTIGWGSISKYWGKDILIVPVRFSRFSHYLLDNSDTFTVSVPKSGELKKELAYCGTKSGRDVDKFAELGLTPVDGKDVPTPIVKEAYIHYECKIVAKTDLTGEQMNGPINEGFYQDNDYHTLYFGEIINVYLSE